MPFTASSFILLSTVLFSTTTVISAFNITRLLSNHPEFSKFNDLLTQTGVAAAINSRQTITVLVVGNSALGPVTSKPLTTTKNILATHVILDYYDMAKLSDLSKKTALLITLFQTTGIADGQQGFLNVTTASGGDVVFGSAEKGAPHDSKAVKAVAAQPFNISVIEISHPIIVPGLDQTAPPVAAPPPKKAGGGEGQAPTPVSGGGAPPPKKAGGDGGQAPTPVSGGGAPPPKKAGGGGGNGQAPTPNMAEGPTEDEAVEGPMGEGPAASGPSPGPAPASQEAVTADTESPAKLAPQSKNGGARVSCLGGVMVAGSMGFLALAL